MAPTRIYVKSLLPLVKTGKVHALAHITGGGLLENIPPVLPKTLHAHIDADAWPQPRLTAFLQAPGHIEPEDMARTFTCPLAMAVCVEQADAPHVNPPLEAAGGPVLPFCTTAPRSQGYTPSGAVH